MPCGDQATRSLWLRSALQLAALCFALVLHTRDGAACQSFPLPQQVHAVGFYKPGTGGSIPDPVLVERDRNAMAAIRAAIEFVTWEGDKTYRSRDSVGADCLAQLFVEWARSRALLTEPKELEGVYVRNNFAGAFAIAYLRVMNSLAQDQQALVATWFDQLGHQIAGTYHKYRLEKDNLYYWTGFSTAAISLVTGNEALRNYAEGVLRLGSSQIAADGSLPAESLRQHRALIYHLFAAEALVATYAILATEGVPIGERTKEDLGRLVRFDLQERCDPAFLERRTGKSQEATDETLAWLLLWETAAGVRKESSCSITFDRTFVSRLGGDVLITRSLLESRFSHPLQ